MNRSVWILTLGRFVSMTVVGFTTFYAPVYFVKFAHISATLVGLGLAANSLSGTMARVIAGSMSDSPRFGRRVTLTLAASIMAAGSVLMGLGNGFAWFVFANTLLGFGAGLYWPASDTMIADTTTEKNRREAYAINRFADYSGLATGIILAGGIIQYSMAFQLLFFIGAALYVINAAAIIFGTTETKSTQPSASLYKLWAEALKNPLLQLYTIANILMTAYVTQITSCMPLYMSDRVRLAPDRPLEPGLLSAMVAGQVIILALSQIPVTRLMNRFSTARSLILSCAIWFLGFVLAAVMGLVSSNQIIVAMAALLAMSIATAAYAPPSSALIVDLAPPESLAIYFSINSLCWALGAMLGPPLVLSSMEHFHKHSPYIWLVVAATTIFPAILFQFLSRHTARQTALTAQNRTEP